MKVVLANDPEAIRCSFQEDFPEVTECVVCKGEARLAFVAHEMDSEDDGKYVCFIRDNGGKGDFWPHDSCSVAIYFCKECFKPCALFNQA